MWSGENCGATRGARQVGEEMITAVALRRCLGMRAESRDEGEGRESSRWLRTVIWIGLLAFALVQYLPVSGKVQNNIVYVAVLIPALLLALMQSRDVAGLVRSAWPLWLFFASVACAAVFLAEWQFLKTSFYTSLFCIGVALLEKARPRSTEVIFSIFFFWSVLILAYAFGTWLVSGFMNGNFKRMLGLGGSAENPIYAGILIASAMSYYAFSYAGDRSLVRPNRQQIWRIAGCLFLAILAVMVFESRSALLGTGLAFCAFGLIAGNMRLIMPLLVTAGVLLIVLSTSQNGVIWRGLSYRPEIWSDALRIWTTDCSVWLGCGKTGELFLNEYRGSHSGYVGTLFRHGVVGALGLAVFLAWYLARGLRRRNRWFLVSLVGWGSMLSAMDGLVGSPAAWWLFVWFPTMAALVEQERMAAE